jgi:hypothetical protein
MTQVSFSLHNNKQFRGASWQRWAWRHYMGQRQTLNSEPCRSAHWLSSQSSDALCARVDLGTKLAILSDNLYRKNAIKAE